MINIIPGRRNKVALNSIPNARRAYPGAIQSALIDVGLKNEGTARAMILARPKTGRVYNVVIRGRRVKHRASAPGEAPANMTGALQKSLGFEVTGASWMEFGANTPYARELELGSAKRNLAERPYLKATVKKTQGFAFIRLARGPHAAMTAGGR